MYVTNIYIEGDLIAIFQNMSRKPELRDLNYVVLNTGRLISVYFDPGMFIKKYQQQKNSAH